MGLGEALGIIVAACGLILGVRTFMMSLRERVPQIKVTLDTGHVNNANPISLALVAVNTGSKTITLTLGGIILPTGEELLWANEEADGNPVFSMELLEGKNYILSWHCKQISRFMKSEYGLSGRVKLTGFYRDALGATHKSMPLMFNVDEWIELK